MKLTAHTSSKPQRIKYTWEYTKTMLKSINLINYSYTLIKMS